MKLALLCFLLFLTIVSCSTKLDEIAFKKLESDFDSCRSVVDKKEVELEGKKFLSHYKNSEYVPQVKEMIARVNKDLDRLFGPLEKALVINFGKLYKGCRGEYCNCLEAAGVWDDVVLYKTPDINSEIVKKLKSGSSFREISFFYKVSKVGRGEIGGQIVLLTYDDTADEMEMMVSYDGKIFTSQSVSSLDVLQYPGVIDWAFITTLSKEDTEREKIRKQKAKRKKRHCKHT